MGTIDPEISGLPFIPFYDVINREGMEHLKLLLGRGDILAANSGKITSPEVIAVRQQWPDRAIRYPGAGAQAAAAGLCQARFH
ncbi:MAG: hypothetical protein ACOX33_10075 [Dethiobacteria bacterium]